MTGERVDQRDSVPQGLQAETGGRSAAAEESNLLGGNLPRWVAGLPLRHHRHHHHHQHHHHHYQGGLQCCHHDTILLDKDQTPPEEKLTYHLKFRFYFQPYTAEPPSHRNLLRMWHQV